MSKLTVKRKNAGVIAFDPAAKVSDYEELSRGLGGAISSGKNGTEGGSKPGKRFEKTHETILKAASELFAHKGFKGSTTRDIAVGAGVTEITLYRHFKSKEDIFFEIIKNMSLLSIADELTNLGAKMGIRNKLEHIGLKFIELFKKRSNEFRIMLSETITRPDMSKMFFETVPSRGIEMLSQMMRKEINDGNFTKADPKLLARAFIGMFLAYNLMQEIFLGKEREPYEDSDIAKFFTRIFLNGALKK